MNDSVLTSKGSLKQKLQNLMINKTVTETPAAITEAKTNAGQKPKDNFKGGSPVKKSKRNKILRKKKNDRMVLPSVDETYRNLSMLDSTTDSTDVGISVYKRKVFKKRDTILPPQNFLLKPKSSDFNITEGDNTYGRNEFSFDSSDDSLNLDIAKSRVKGFIKRKATASDRLSLSDSELPVNKKAKFLNSFSKKSNRNLTPDPNNVSERLLEKQNNSEQKLVSTVKSGEVNTNHIAGRLESDQSDALLLSISNSNADNASDSELYMTSNANVSLRRNLRRFSNSNINVSNMDESLTEGLSENEPKVKYHFKRKSLHINLDSIIENMVQPNDLAEELDGVASVSIQESHANRTVETISLSNNKTLPVRQSPRKKSPVRNLSANQLPIVNLTPTKKSVGVLPTTKSPDNLTPTRNLVGQSSSRNSPVNVTPTKEPVGQMSSRKSLVDLTPTRESIGRSPSRKSPINITPTKESVGQTFSRKSPVNLTPTRESFGRSPSRKSPVSVTLTKELVGQSSSRKSPVNLTPTKESVGQSPSRKSTGNVTPAKESIGQSSSRKSPVNLTPTKESVGLSPSRNSRVNVTPTKESVRQSSNRKSPVNLTPTNESVGQSPSRKSTGNVTPTKESVVQSPIRKSSVNLTPTRESVGQSPSRKSPVIVTPTKESVVQSPIRKSPVNLTPTREPVGQSPSRKSLVIVTPAKKSIGQSPINLTPTRESVGLSPAGQSSRRSPRLLNSSYNMLNLEESLNESQGKIEPKVKVSLKRKSADINFDSIIENMVQQNDLEPKVLDVIKNDMALTLGSNETLLDTQNHTNISSVSKLRTTNSPGSHSQKVQTSPILPQNIRPPIQSPASKSPRSQSTRKSVSQLQITKLPDDESSTRELHIFSNLSANTFDSDESLIESQDKNNLKAKKSFKNKSLHVNLNSIIEDMVLQDGLVEKSAKEASPDNSRLHSSKKIASHLGDISPGSQLSIRKSPRLSNLTYSMSNLEESLNEGESKFEHNFKFKNKGKPSNINLDSIIANMQLIENNKMRTHDRTAEADIDQIPSPFQNSQEFRSVGSSKTAQPNTPLIQSVHSPNSQVSVGVDFAKPPIVHGNSHQNQLETSVQNTPNSKFRELWYTPEKNLDNVQENVSSSRYLQNSPQKNLKESKLNTQKSPVLGNTDAQKSPMINENSTTNQPSTSKQSPKSLLNKKQSTNEENIHGSEVFSPRKSPRLSQQKELPNNHKSFNSAQKEGVLRKSPQHSIQKALMLPDNLSQNQHTPLLTNKPALQGKLSNPKINLLESLNNVQEKEEFTFQADSKKNTFLNISVSTSPMVAVSKKIEIQPSSVSFEKSMESSPASILKPPSSKLKNLRFDEEEILHIRKSRHSNRSDIMSSPNSYKSNAITSRSFISGLISPPPQFNVQVSQENENTLKTDLDSQHITGMRDSSLSVEKTPTIASQQLDLFHANSSEENIETSKAGELNKYEVEKDAVHAQKSFTSVDKLFYNAYNRGKVTSGSSSNKISPTEINSSTSNISSVDSLSGLPSKVSIGKQIISIGQRSPLDRLPGTVTEVELLNTPNLKLTSNELLKARITVNRNKHPKVKTNSVGGGDSQQEIPESSCNENESNGNLKQLTLHEFLERMSKGNLPKSKDKKVSFLSSMVKRTEESSTPKKSFKALNLKPSKSSKSSEKLIKNMPLRMNDKVFKNASKHRMSKSAIKTVHEVTEIFFANLSSDLQVISTAKKEPIISFEHIFLLMKEIKFVSSKEELYSKLQENFPSNEWLKIVPTQFANNIVLPTKPSKF